MYSCTKGISFSSRMFPSLFVVILGLCYCSEENSESSLGIPRLYGPSEALVKTIAEFNCELLTYPDGEPVLLQLFKAGNRDNFLAEYTSLDGEIAAFPMIIKLHYEGNLECVARLRNNSNVEPTVSNIHHLRVVEPVRDARIEVLSGRVEFFEGETLELRCKVSAGNHVSYKWLLNDQLVSHSHVHGEILVINRTTSKDSGSYMCVATNIFNKTKVFNSSSTEIITVKDMVSHPDISFTVSKEDSHSYSAMVTCQSTKGTPPITFSIYMTELVASTITQERNAKFKVPLVLGEHLGWLQCQARNADQTAYSAWIRLEVEPVRGAWIEVLSGRVEFFEGETLELRCKVSAGNHVSYKWLLNDQLVTHSHVHGEFLVINRTTSKDSGSYMCVATNIFNKTKVFNSSSTEIITVKDMVSRPDISFTVSKEDSLNYSAMVTCQSTKGTPPITFSICNMTELVASTITQERNAKFKVPLVLGEHLGWLQCQARNADQTAYSAWIRLEVVPVSGPVMIHYDYDFGENYAVTIVRFYCKAAEGSLPRYQWFLNKTLLHDRGSFYYVDHQPPEQSILVLSVSRSSAGTYHCEVSDSFDNTTAINSKRWYLDKEELNRLPVLVVVVVFGCFTALLLVVTICCWVGVVFRRRRYGGKSLVALEMDRMVDAGEPDLKDFTDDADVVKTASDVEFDQASEASVDEWPQIEEEKTTIEDEPAEEP
uniref:Fc receptor-like protein 3 isoform X3 n=1 Tax=Scatophagus argus TaxID=75038 RepID=UPI001ED8387C|nr:Fc receptor-like protein 3 isoform X3 [Scatophagus argus]